MVRALLLGCVAGVAAGLVFHQGAMWLLHVLTAQAGVGLAAFGRVPFPWSTAPLEPFRVPRVVQWSLTTAVAGAWLGSELYWRTTEELERRKRDLLLGLVLGGPLLFFIGVLPVWAKGLPRFLDGNDRSALLAEALLSGVWGWGTALLLRLLVRAP